MGSKVTTQHAEYTINSPCWTLVRDCYAGSATIKGKRQVYLPIPNSDDKSTRNMKKYDNYLMRAMFTNVIAPTTDIVLGSIFRRPAKTKIPEQISFIENFASPDGKTLIEYSKELVTEIAVVGRQGILIDQSCCDAPDNKAEELKRGIFPRLVSYTPESITNWREKIIDGICKVNLVVLKEMIQDTEKDTPETNRDDYDPMDEVFCPDMKTCYRVLWLKDDSVYVQQLWDCDGKQIPFPGTSEFEVVPTKSNGEGFSYIPFVFLGANTNSCSVDKSPFLPLAELSIGHYRNSADLEETCFWSGQATLVTTGLTQGWVDKNFSGGIALGSGASVPLPPKADAKFIQAAPNNIVAVEMKDKEDRMLKLGMRSTDGATGRETAEAAKIRNSVDNAIMTKLSVNVSDGITKALYYLYDYTVGTTAEEGSISFQLNKIFYAAMIDSQAVIQLIALHDQGLITFEELRDNLKELGIIVDDSTDIIELEKMYTENKQVSNIDNTNQGIQA